MTDDQADKRTPGPTVPASPTTPNGAAGATGPNPLSEPVPNSPPDVSPNPAPPAIADLETTDLAVLERRLREAISRAERGTELLEAAIRRKRHRG
jgi:hypothetical protein